MRARRRQLFSLEGKRFSYIFDIIWKETAPPASCERTRRDLLPKQTTTACGAQSPQVAFLRLLERNSTTGRSQCGADRNLSCSVITSLTIAMSTSNASTSHIFPRVTRLTTVPSAVRHHADLTDRNKETMISTRHLAPCCFAAVVLAPLAFALAWRLPAIHSFALALQSPVPHKVTQCAAFAALLILYSSITCVFSSFLFIAVYLANVRRARSVASLWLITLFQQIRNRRDASDLRHHVVLCARVTKKSRGNLSPPSLSKEGQGSAKIDRFRSNRALRRNPAHFLRKKRSNHPHSRHPCTISLSNSAQHQTSLPRFSPILRTRPNLFAQLPLRPELRHRVMMSFHCSLLHGRELHVIRLIRAQICSR